MNRNIYTPIILLVLLFSGCASNSGVTPLEKDTYIVTRQAATGFSGTGTLKASAIKEAAAYCKSKGLELKIVAITESQPPYVLGNFPKAEVVFRALPKGSPELSEASHYDAYGAQIKVGEKATERSQNQTLRINREEGDVYDQLLKLNKLKEEGILTDEEFLSEKKRLLKQLE